jgi:hypothetical protein
MIHYPAEVIMKMLKEGLAEGTLEKLPRDRLPMHLFLAMLSDETRSNPEFEPEAAREELCPLEPIFAFDWGYLVLSGPDEDELHPSVSISIYVDATLANAFLNEFFQEYFPRVLERRLMQILKQEPERRGYTICPPGSGKAAWIWFCFDDDPARVKREWIALGATLAMLVEGLSHQITAFLALAATVRYCGPFPPAFTS